MPRLLRFAKLFIAGSLVFGTTPLQAASSESTRSGRSTGSARNSDHTDSIQHLIDQLGSEQYFLRRQAEEELIHRGAEAFDPLQEAEKDSDLEIATRAHYILQQIRIEWTHPDDSADVQSIMHRYGELSKAERVEKMDQLLALADDEGLGALCRIARYEPASHLARYAALKVMQAKSPPDRATKGVEVMTRELDDSQRTPARWLHTYAEQLAEPDRVFDAWLKLIDDEIALIKEDSPDTESAFVFELIDFQLDLYRGKNQPEAVFAGLRRRTNLYVEQSGRLRDGLLFTMIWLWDNEEWQALELVEDHYATAIREQRLLLYYSAAARWKQGREALAEDFAERAFSLEAEDAEERDDIGEVIGELGRHDWAEREWWHAVETFPVLDVNSLRARSSLASLRLHDRGEDQQAADLMAEICDAVDADAKLKVRREFNRFRSQKEYFLACQAARDGNYAEQRKHLDAAYGLDPEDADVLIAMYRSPGADKNFRQTTLRRVQGAANKVAAKIEQQPDNAQWYNHWAWLISNTKGDYDQAVKHSLHSLELSPDSPSYLDTLGRCYYTVGNLDEAVKAQREAVRRHPHLQVMRDQLALIETALVKRETK